MSLNRSPENLWANEKKCDLKKAFLHATVKNLGRGSPIIAINLIESLMICKMMKMS